MTGMLSGPLNGLKAPYRPLCSSTYNSWLSYTKIPTTRLAAASDRGNDEQLNSLNNRQNKLRRPEQTSQQQDKLQQQQAQQQQPKQQQPNRQQKPKRSGAVLRWRSGTPPATADIASGQPGAAPSTARAEQQQQQRDDTTVTSGTGNAAARLATPGQQSADASHTAAAAAGTDTEPAAQSIETAIINPFTPAKPPPGYFRPQTTTVTAEEGAAFLLEGINQQFATPTPLQEQIAAQKEAEEQQQAELTAAKQQLPPDYQARLAAAASNAAAALAAAKGRAGGLSADQLAVAETAVAVASGTRSPFTAEMAQDVVSDIAAGREPDPECVELLTDPMLLVAEQFDTVGPEFDQLFFSSMEGNPAGDLDWLSITAEGLLEYFEDCQQWEALARLFTTARGCVFLQLPHLLLLLRRLPGLVRAEELGFRARLRLEVLLGDLMEELLSHSEVLTASQLNSICLAVGRLTPPTRTFDYGPPLQTLVDKHLPALTVRQCADVLWGFGKAGVQVEARWVGKVWTNMVQRRREVPLDTVSFAKGLFACALLSFKPPRQQLQPFYAACEEHAAAFSPVQLSNTLWAVATLELQPPPSWLHAVLTELLLGQSWSTDGQTLSIVQPTGLVKHWKDDLIAETVADVSTNVRVDTTTPAPAAAAAGTRQPAPAAAAVSRALAAALSAPIPATVAAAVDAAAPCTFQSPSEGPGPVQPDSLHHYWLQLLAASNCGSSNIPDGVLQLSHIYPKAPHSLSMLNPVQLSDFIDALANLQLSSDDADVAALFDQIWSAAVAVTSGSYRSSIEAEEHDTTAAAAALPVTLLQQILEQQQQQQKQPKSRPNKQPGFASSRSPKQQQKQKQDSSKAAQLLNPEILSQFDSLTGGLWGIAVAEAWRIGHLATAAAMLNSSSSSSAPVVCNSWIAANRAVADCMEAWYAASEVLLPHMEPVAVVKSLLAVASITDQDTSPLGPRGFPDQFLQQWNVAYSRANYQPTQLAAAAAAGHAASPSQAPTGATEGASAGQMDGTSHQQERMEQQQQERKCTMLLLPPLPPRRWLAAAVQRLVTTRSAYSEVALLRVFEALAELLSEHPEREVLLQQQQQQQQQYQWWWQMKQLVWEEERPVNSPAAAAAVVAQQHEAAAVAVGAPPLAQQPSTSSSTSSSSVHDTGDTANVLWPDSWLQCSVDSSRRSSHSNTSTSGGKEGCGDDSSSSSSSSSILPGLWVLSRCLGHALGELLPPAIMVEAACTLASVSPVLLDEHWLQQHEEKLVLQLQQQGWTPSSSQGSTSITSSSRKRSTPAAAGSKSRSTAGVLAALSCSARTAAAAGLTPSSAYLLLTLHEQCGYFMRNAALLEACRELVSALHAKV